MKQQKTDPVKQILTFSSDYVFFSPNSTTAHAATPDGSQA
jgi:hypothetical protein